MTKTERKAFIKSCRRQGIKYIRIASLLGISRQRVDQILHANKHVARNTIQKARLKNFPANTPYVIQKNLLTLIIMIIQSP